MSAPTTHIQRLHLRHSGPARLETSQRVVRALEGMDLRPPELPPSAVLVVRRLADPRPGFISPSRRGLHAFVGWERAMREHLRDVLRSAVRPRNGQIPASAEAVLYLDAAEARAGLVAARCGAFGPPSTLWWAPGLSRTLHVRSQETPAAILGAAPEALPAVWHVLETWALDVPVRASLSTPNLDRLTEAAAQTMGVNLTPPGMRPVSIPDLAAAVSGEPAFPTDSGEPSEGTGGEKKRRPAEASAATVLRMLYHAPHRVHAAARQVAQRRAVSLSSSAPADRLAPDSATPEHDPEGKSSPSRERDAPPDSVSEPDFALDAPFSSRSVETEASTTPDASSAPAVSEMSTISETHDATDSASDPSDPASRDPSDASVADRLGSDGEDRSPSAPAPENPAPNQERDGGSKDRASGRASEEKKVESRRNRTVAETEHERSSAVSPDSSHEMSSAAEAAEARVVQTTFGGVAYLVNVMDALDWPAADPFEASGAEMSPHDVQGRAWALLEGLARRVLGIDEPEAAGWDDPLWRLLATLDGREPDVPGSDAVVETWVDAVLPFLQGRVAIALGVDPPELDWDGLLRLDAVIRATPLHLDVLLALNDIRLDVRRAGLDRDPGWTPAFGRVIRLHFQ